MSKVLDIESVKDTTLYKELISRSNDDTKAFVTNILTLCDEASDRATMIPKFFSEYTLHDKTHFLRVAELMSYILGETLKSLNDIEIGLLILAAFNHDQGMFINDDEYKSLEENDAYLIFRDNWYIDHANYGEIKRQIESSFISTKEKDRLLKIKSELDTAMLTDYLRESHGQRSHDYILEKYTDDKMLIVSGTNISDYLAKICLSHVKSINWINSKNGFNHDENIGTYQVNTVFLSIILRLADILDFDSDRTPEVLYKSIHFTSPVSISEWQKHRDVKGWEISKDLIRFTMYFEHPVYEKTANSFLDWIDSELNNSHNLIRRFPQKVSKYKIEVAEKVDRERLGPKNNSYLYHDLEFSLSRDEIVKLLMTDKLYQNTSLFIRELLQNSLDALRLRKSIHKADGFEWNAGRIFFKHFIDDNGQQVIECIDNGIGMDEDIVSKFFGKVGRSFYRSPEFERQRAFLKEKGVDFEPCSQFGIGFMSCFMVGDRIQLLTRKDYGQGKENGKPLIVEINGLGGLILIKEGESTQPIGTTVRIFSRNKPLFFDDWSDNIRLLLTLKGYALGTEFPIEASCEIDEIKGELNIPATIDRKRTFLEKIDIKNKKTLEVDLSSIDKNLRGFLRQTFLVDENGLPCTENLEARWEPQVDNVTWKDKEKSEMTLLVKSTNQNIKYNYHLGLEEGHSVCLDGILVCGYPGRSGYSKYEMMMLGHRASQVSSEHPFTIDVRGKIKPELSPARTPLDKGSIFNRPVGWKNLQNLLSRGSAIIWEEILSYTDEGLTPDTFWKLLLIYNGHPIYINSNILYDKLKLPSANSWIKLSQIVNFTFDNKIISAKDNQGSVHSICFSDEIVKIGKTHINGIDFNYWLTNLLISISKLKFRNDKVELVIRDNFLTQEIPANNIISREMSGIRFIPFEGFTTNYITTTKYKNIANWEHPLVKFVINSQYVERKDELQEFANALIFNLCYLIQKLEEDKKPFSTSVGLRSLKYTSILFMNINWANYPDELKPPYKIYVDNDKTVEITEDVFKEWAKQKFK
ncbi:histidine kinase/DNA gyrase B/HSP90-like ATPase [Ancylomarina subtilis]|uniref:Histidine kinase/DNA gyrase B/HSP90-like ATPase n=1 Tax=Ancylomarina subtilis TaxID=1639035 RepID=A0A4Q7VI36_9BACT|nr:ATP-binding protein [Ancylomarina subtilis]RZT95598.1 histidine kinase/DNA gyrase B/HSP90-like ATPase [Ancylomarina subtilis]